MHGIEHLSCESPTSLVEFLSTSGGLSAENALRLHEMGSIYLNEKRIPQSGDLNSIELKKGDYVRVHKEPRRFPVHLFNYSKSLIFENEDLVVINKPSGLPVPPTVDNIRENINYLVSKGLGKETHVTHRLDVPTSGLLVLAKTKEGQKKFNALLAEGKVKKLYRAHVHGFVENLNQLTHFMKPSPYAPKVVSKTAENGWQICKLNILDSQEIYANHSMVIIELLTGRTHQIRCQLSNEGHPIIGDLMYGSSVKLSASHDQIALECFFLSFPWQGTDLILKLPNTNLI